MGRREPEEGLLTRDFEFFAVGAAECRSLAREIYDDTGALVERFDPGAGQPSRLYASLLYRFASDGRFRVRAIAVLRGGDVVAREHTIDTCRAPDREIDFRICAAATDRHPKPGREEKARRRTDGNLREVFG